jgi:hypothetical protein
VAYATSAQVERYLKNDIPAAEATRVSEMLTDCTTLIDAYTGHTWTSATEARRFEANEKQVLEIDPCLSVTTVVLTEPDIDDDTLEEETDFYLLPGGAGNYPTAPYRQPYRYIKAIAGVWPSPPAYLTITATWADANACPGDVQIACALTVAAWVHNLGIVDGAGEVVSERWDGYQVQYAKGVTETANKRELFPVSALAILDKYREDDQTWVVGI